MYTMKNETICKTQIDLGVSRERGGGKLVNSALMSSLDWGRGSDFQSVSTDRMHLNALYLMGH